jgi:bifunctional non-homologous end joining protein LigD
MPKIIHPELATLTDKPPRGDNWVHEVKLDGYRIIAHVNKTKVSLITRKNNDYTNRYKNVVAALKKLNLANTILDGEVVVLDEDQHSDFQLLQNALNDRVQKDFIYYVFDVLEYKGQDVTKLTLLERKKILKKIIPSAKGRVLRYSDYITGSGEEVFAACCELGLEGIVSKNAKGTYVQARTRDWLKTKCISRQEFVICGYTQPRNSRSHFGALLLGYYKAKKLIYCGRVGTGFNQKSLEEIFKQLLKNKSNVMPYAERPPESKHVTWVKPVLVAEIEYREITRDGILRQPSFKGLRIDKTPSKVILEK